MSSNQHDKGASGALVGMPILFGVILGAPPTRGATGLGLNLSPRIRIPVTDCCVKAVRDTGPAGKCVRCDKFSKLSAAAVAAASVTGNPLGARSMILFLLSTTRRRDVGF